MKCTYKNGEPREVNPEVCQWHFEKQDPACADCQVFKALARRSDGPVDLESKSE